MYKELKCKNIFLHFKCIEKIKAAVAIINCICNCAKREN